MSKIDRKIWKSYTEYGYKPILDESLYQYDLLTKDEQIEFLRFTAEEIERWLTTNEHYLIDHTSTGWFRLGWDKKIERLEVIYSVLDELEWGM